MRVFPRGRGVSLEDHVSGAIAARVAPQRADRKAWVVVNVNTAVKNKKLPIFTQL
jgi:hypothetical protein